MSSQLSPPSGPPRPALPWILLALAAAAAATLSPLWISLVLAAWFASLTRRLWERLSQRLGQRPRLAAVLTVVALVLLVVPLVGVGVSLGMGGAQFVRRIAASEENRSRLVQLVTDQPSTSELPRFEISSLVNLLQEHGSKAWQVVRAIAGKTATGLVGLVIFLFGAYTFLVDGQRFIISEIENLVLELFGKLDNVATGNSINDIGMLVRAEFINVRRTRRREIKHCQDLHSTRVRLFPRHDAPAAAIDLNDGMRMNCSIIFQD